MSELLDQVPHWDYVLGFLVWAVGFIVVAMLLKRTGSYQSFVFRALQIGSWSCKQNSCHVTTYSLWEMSVKN